MTTTMTPACALAVQAIAAAGGLHTASSLADHLGVTREGVRLMTKRDDFPAPIIANSGRERTITLWLLDDVLAWNRKYRTREDV